MIVDGKVNSNKEIAEDIYHLILSAPKSFKALPGQFINILVSDSFKPLLRRPFSVFDCGKDTVEIVYKVIGDGTKLLSEKKAGETLNYIGPLGNPYPIVNPKSKIRNPKLKGSGIEYLVLVGGGTGAASIYFLAKYLKQKRIKFILIQGARKKCHIVALKNFKTLGAIFATEDGSMGTKGFVTDCLKTALKDNSVIFTCGPKPMFKAIQKTAASMKNVTILASFEEYMGCGMGACLSCVVAVKDKNDFQYKRVCKEGPVFNLKTIEF